MNTKDNHRVIFENVYVTYYSRMKFFALEYVIREEDAENIVQDVFLNLWEQNLLLLSHTNLFSLLFTAVKNRCIDFLRHKTIVQKSVNRLQDEYMEPLQLKYHSLEAFNDSLFYEPDIETVIQNAIDSLPEKCKQIFILNKIEGKKQKNIAQELNISVNTVENQMTIAYKKLKELLKDYISLIIFLII